LLVPRLTYAQLNTHIESLAILMQRLRVISSQDPSLGPLLESIAASLDRIRSTLQPANSDADDVARLLERNRHLTLDAARNDARLRELFMKYTRAESMRKALIYQKKYLLLLLGGFQESEEVTLSMIASMGVSPSLAMRTRVLALRGKLRAAFVAVRAATRLRLVTRRRLARFGGR
jgi:hypothetical protein